MDELVRAIEATLFASATPLSKDEIAEHVGEGDVAAALAELAAHYGSRGVQLVERLDQRLGDEPPAEPPEMPGEVG